MTSSKTLLRSSRLFHLYSGVFLAPALLFFAITGGLQTFSYHETTRGSSYKPPAILVKLGQLHKKQTLVVPERKGPPPEAKPQASTGADGRLTTKQKIVVPADQATPSSPSESSAKTGGPPEAAGTAKAPPTGPAKQNLLPMKIFFLVASVGLVFSTLTGLYMSYRFAHRKLYISLTLLAGILVPAVLLLVQ